MGLNAPVQHGKETLKKILCSTLSQAFVHILNVASIAKLVQKKKHRLLGKNSFTNSCQRVGSWVININILLQSLLQYFFTIMIGFLKFPDKEKQNKKTTLNTDITCMGDYF